MRIDWTRLRHTIAGLKELRPTKLGVALLIVLGLLLIGGIVQIVSDLATYNSSTARSASKLYYPLLYADASNLQVGLKAYAAHDGPTTTAVDQVIKKAKQVMKQPITTVTAKSQTPPSGDKHDYYSLADYWWPNPKTSNHLPYIRKDGQVNPETTTIPDKANFNNMLNIVTNTALAYYYTGQPAYANKTAAEIKAWFVTPATKMNPNLNYAQQIKGVANDGTGLIDLRYLPQALDAATLISGSGDLSSQDTAAIQSWATSYLKWLLTSDPGKTQANEPNNHASWYDAQVIALSVYLGKADTAQQYATHVTKLIASQVKPDGTQPLELARTKPWDYSTLNLEALLTAGIAAKNTKVNILQYTADDGASIQLALNYLTPYVTGKTWPYKQISGFNADKIANVLTMAQRVYGKDFGVSAKQLDQLDPDATISLEYPPL